jgi:F-type H+-transporting ATPase subunit a
MEQGIEVALSAEPITTLYGIPITNTLITSVVVVLLLVGVGILVGRRPKLVPGRIQLMFEMALTFVLDYAAEILENDKVARRFFPLFMTLFLFIFTSNILEFTPGIGSIGFFQGEGFIPLLRSVNTDLNVTLALAIIAVITIEVAGIFAVGFFRYAGKFINFSKPFPLNFVVGLIELISELSRFVSFSFRLFGNVFAGEVLLAVVGLFAPYIVPVPLMAFEMFVGFIQAVVFSMLTLFFIKLAIADPHGGEENHGEGGPAVAH